MRCEAHIFGCGCTHCRADIHIPPPRKSGWLSQFILAVVCGLVIGTSAYIGLSRVERAYQMEERV